MHGDHLDGDPSPAPTSTSTPPMRKSCLLLPKGMAKAYLVKRPDVPRTETSSRF